MTDQPRTAAYDDGPYWSNRPTSRTYIRRVAAVVIVVLLAYFAVDGQIDASEARDEAKAARIESRQNGEDLSKVLDLLEGQTATADAAADAVAQLAAQLQKAGIVPVVTTKPGTVVRVPGPGGSTTTIIVPGPTARPSPSPSPRPNPGPTRSPRPGDPRPSPPPPSPSPTRAPCTAYNPLTGTCLVTISPARDPDWLVALLTGGLS